MNEKNIDKVIEAVSEARLEYLAQLAYVMDLDSIISTLKDPFAWQKIVPEKTEEARIEAIKVYEAKASEASLVQREKLMKLEALEATLKEIS